MALSISFSVYNYLLSSVFCFFFLLSYQKKVHVYGITNTRPDDNNRKPYHVVPVKSLEPNPKCTGSTGGSSVGSPKIKVTYRYGPCSPIGHGKKVPSSDEIFFHDQIRVHSMNINQSTDQHPPTKDSKVATIPVSDRSTKDNNYAITIGFGTPTQTYTLIFDTGSDRTWLQCNPCSNCYKQDELPMFDPSLSHTYHKGSCKSYNGNNYTQNYEDGSYSKGFVGCDTLTLEPSVVVTNFEFGCGQDNSQGFGTAAGMLGLGQGKDSLISQAESVFGKAFSYCLPPTSSSIGYLLFGKQAKSSTSFSSLKFTPLLPNPSYPSFYFVQLIGITVGKKRLNVSPSVFSTPGTIVDSGTVTTRLPTSVYYALRTEFQNSMSKYPSAPAVEILDTCYDFSAYKNSNVTYPNIVFHFGGNTDVSLDRSGIFWRKSINQVCLAFAATKRVGDLTIIGSTQQQALHVFYDLQGRRIGFGANGCS